VAGYTSFVRFADTFMLTSKHRQDILLTPIAFNPLRPDVPGLASAWHHCSILYCGSELRANGAEELIEAKCSRMTVYA
jgi:hypothetical protein